MIVVIKKVFATATTLVEQTAMKLAATSMLCEKFGLSAQLVFFPDPRYSMHSYVYVLYWGSGNKTITQLMKIALQLSLLTASDFLFMSQFGRQFCLYPPLLTAHASHSKPEFA